MLILIGLGLFDEYDLTLRAIEEAKKADLVFIELYTSKWYGNLQNLENLINNKVIVIQRKNLEENSQQFLEKAKIHNVVVFVQGDPLIATTHTTLLLGARKLGIKTKVIHNASIISAIAETGLHIYKFGPVVTIPFPEKTKGKLPESVYQTIAENKKHGLHTLCLLDVVAEENKYMTVKEAIDILLQMEKKFRKKILTENSEVVIFSRAGSNNPLIVCDKIKNITKDFEVPTVLIIPGKLHFTEKEYLNKL